MQVGGKFLECGANTVTAGGKTFQIATGTGDNLLFLVMEFLEGMPAWSLRNRIRERPEGLDPAEVLALFCRYLDALQYLHENIRRIIHRDIKPGNLYAPKDNAAAAKLLDLGVARDVSGTQTYGATPGTLQYMAPEFVTSASRGSARTDIYALGLSLYEALTGKPIFSRVSSSGQQAVAEYMKRITADDGSNVDFSHDVFKRYPRLVKIVRKATARNPASRYSRAGKMRAEMIELLDAMGAIESSGIEDFDEAGGTMESAVSVRAAARTPRTVGKPGMRMRWLPGTARARRGTAVVAAVILVALSVWFAGSDSSERIAAAWQRLLASGGKLEPAMSGLRDRGVTEKRVQGREVTPIPELTMPTPVTDMN